MAAKRTLSIAATCFFITACGSSSNDLSGAPDSAPLSSAPLNDAAPDDANSDNQDAGQNTGQNPDSTLADNNETNNEELNSGDTSNGANFTDTNGSTDTTESDQTDNTSVTNRFCQPVTTSVVFEAYSTPDQGPVSYGRYVPNPSVGFGWSDGVICDLAQSYGVDEIEVLVPYVRNRPDTDGVTSNAEWSAGVAASQVDYVTSRNDIDNLLLSPVPDYLDGAGYSRWRAMHDGTNLYLDVYVSSDSSTSIYTDSEQPWHDDSIEIFIDGDNSKDLAYDGINDFQVTLLAQPGVNEPVVSGSSASGLGIFYRSGAGRGTMRYEVSINLESAGIEIGKPFGFDVHINEDDNGGDRDAKWGWFEKTGNDRSWFNPSVLGTLLLTDCDDRITCGSYQVLSR